MLQKTLRFSHETLNNGDLHEVAVRGDVDMYRRLSTTVRERLYLLFKASGIAPEKILMLDMMLKEPAPDILNEQRLGKLLAEIHEQVMSVSTDTEKNDSAKPVPSGPKTRNPESIVHYQEMMERFDKLGVEFYELVMKWEGFYERHLYGNAVKKITGRDKYAMSMPTVTHEAMQALEKAYEEGIIDRFMIDDGRIADGKTLRLFEPKTFRRFKQMHKYKQSADAETFLNQSSMTPNGVRIIGYKNGPIVFEGRQRVQCFQELRPTEPYRNLMSLGTYIRLYNFLIDQEKDDEVYDLKTYILPANDCALLKDRTILLNNKSVSDNILTIGPCSNDPRMRHIIETGPETTDIAPAYQLPIVIASSDNTNLNLYTRDPGRMMYMDTMPAPADSNEDDVPF